MIDFDKEIKKVNPINIETMEFNRYDIPVDVRNSIIFYNKSVANLQSGNIDIAISNLKKSLTYNSCFCEAIKLLALCYVHVKDFSMAAKTFKMLAKYDVDSSFAKECLERLKVEKNISKTLDAIGVINSNTNDYTNKKENLKKLKKGKASGTKIIGKKVIMFLAILTIIVSGTIFTYLVRSNIINTYNRVLGSTVKTSDHKLEDNNYKDLGEKYSELDKNNKNLEKNLESTKSELEDYKNKYNILMQLNEIEKCYNDGNYEKALDNLLALKEVQLDETSKARFDKLWSDVKLVAGWDIYRAGDNLYKKGNYSEALTKLIKAEAILPDEKIRSWNLYQIAMCYKEINDNKNALVFFQKVKDTYPNSQYAEYSTSMIEQIKSKQ